MKALYVSVNRTFNPDTDTLDDLRNATVHAWRIGHTTASRCEVAVMVYRNSIVAAFTLLGALPNADYPWDTTGRFTRTRTSLILGNPLPINPLWAASLPGLRNGVATVDFAPAPAVAV